MILVTGLAITSQVFPIKERGKAVGINITTLYLGLILGPVLGGFLTNFIGWRSIFYMIFILSLIIVGLIFWKMREGKWTEGKGDMILLVQLFML